MAHLQVDPDPKPHHSTGLILGASWATARFEATDSAESGTFVTTWDEGFYPSSDPCGY